MKVNLKFEILVIVNALSLAPATVKFRKISRNTRDVKSQRRRDNWHGVYIVPTNVSFVIFIPPPPDIIIGSFSSSISAHLNFWSNCVDCSL